MSIGMEKRRQIRVETNEPVVVTELGSNRHHPMGGMIQDVAGDGMLIRLPRALATAALVRLEASNMLLLGEVVRCETDGRDFRVALAIRRSLQSLHDLENLNRALLGYQNAKEQEDSPAPIAIPIMRE
jgi:hypothetical protein